MKVMFSVLFCCLAAVALAEMPYQYRDFWLGRHNNFRRNQFASNMYKMRWNEDLANQAQEWMSNCQFDYENNGQGGMNLAFYMNDYDMEYNMNRAFDSWSNEMNQYQYYQMAYYNQRDVGCYSRRCPQFSAYGQMYENAWFMGCWYSPMNNEMNMNEYPYMMGNSCEECDMCEDGLCVDGYENEFNGYNNEFNGYNNEFNGYNNEFNGYNNEFNGYNNEFNGFNNEFNNNEFNNEFGNGYWGNCEDRHENCIMWSAKGMCGNNRYYMMRWCPRTCGFCQQGGNYQWSNSFNNEDCEDRAECEEYDMQECMNKPWMMEQCPQMCGMC